MSPLLSKEELLNPSIVLRLYSVGAFPMADEVTGEIEWYYPKVRCIIPLDNFNIPRSLKKILKENLFEIRFDYNRMEVVKECGNRKITWINNDLIEMYEKIIHNGNLHSVECYIDDILVGGLFGISIRGAFFGESMFSKVSNASKVALVYLINRLRERNFKILDVQLMNPHLKMFGAIEISENDYVKLLRQAYRTDTSFI